MVTSDEKINLKNSMFPLDAFIVSLLRPFGFECVTEAGRIPIYITAQQSLEFAENGAKNKKSHVN